MESKRRARDVEGELVGPRVRALRKAAGMSQEELARQMGTYGFEMHQVTLGKIETGNRPVRVNEVAALAEIFGVTLDEFLDSRGPAAQGPDADDPVGAYVDLSSALIRAESERDDLLERLPEMRKQLELAKEMLIFYTPRIPEAEWRLKQLNARIELLKARKEEQFEKDDGEEGTRNG